ncbi:hypothetical protein [Candidatus Doolittlea endobia]|uniref:hypothetical protein n=1 Tax=Candidatus Doolittlea endobia TaxID=1778262 RepID=UPI00082A704B
MNKAINHGTPLDIQQTTGTGKSIFLLKLCFDSRYDIWPRNTKQSAGGASTAHFMGGIYEIYFPYVLMNPRLLIAVIFGDATGVFTLNCLSSGLVSPTFPSGSILAI